MILLAFVRSLIGLILFVLTTLLLAIVIIALTYVPAAVSWVDRLTVLWGKSALFFFNVEVKEINPQYVPLGPCVYLFNHTSFFDVFAMVAKLPKMRFGSKIELFKIPFFGQAIRRVGVLPIARQNREEVFKVYEKAIEVALKKGRQYALAPEGTRQMREGKMAPFKAGPFIFAINAKIPLVPVVIKGASKVFAKNAILPNWLHWKAEIVLEYLPPVETDSYQLNQRQELQKLIAEQMNQKFV